MLPLKGFRPKALLQHIIGHYRLKLQPHVLPVCLLCALVLWLCRRLLFYPGLPAGIDFLPFIARVSTLASCPFSVWRPLSLGYPLPFYLDNAVALFARMVGDPVLTVKLVVFFLLCLAGIGMYILCQHFFFNRFASFCAAYVFVVNQAIFANIASGEVTILFFYAFSPIIFLLFDKLISEPIASRAVSFSIIFAVVVWLGRLEPLFYYVLLLGLYVLFKISKPRLIQMCKFAGLVLLVFLLIGAPNFALLIKAPPQYISKLGFRYPIEDIQYRSLDMYASLLGYSRGLSYLDYVAGTTWNKHPFLATWQQRVILLGLLVLVFLPSFITRDRLTLFLVLLVLCTVFLSKGVRPPWGALYEMLYRHLPFWNSLRMASRWLLITWFAYALLLGQGVNLVSRVLVTRGMLTRACLSGILAVFALMPTSLANPYPFSEGFLVWQLPKSLTTPYEWLAKAPAGPRVLTVPYGQQALFTSDVLDIDVDKGWRETDLGSMSTIFHNKPVINECTTESISNDFLSFVSDSVWSGTSSLSKLLGIAAVKYILIQPYPSDPLFHRNPDRFYQHKYFNSLTGLTLLFEKHDAKIYINNNALPMVTSPPNYIVAVGGREALSMLGDLQHFDFSQYAVLLADQIVETAGESHLCRLLEEARDLVFCNSSLLDLAMLTLESGTTIVAANYAQLSDNPSRCWIRSSSGVQKGIINMPTLRTCSENRIQIPFTIGQEQSFELWVRVKEGFDSGTLTVYVDDVLAGVFTPASMAEPRFKWLKIAELMLSEGEHTLTLQNNPSPYGICSDIAEIKIIPTGALERQIASLLETIQVTRPQILRIESIPLRERINWLEITSGDQTSFWETIESESISLSESLDTPESTECTKSLRIAFEHSGRQFFTFLEKIYDEAQDWNESRYLKLYFKGQNTGRVFSLYIYFGGCTDNMVRFDFRDESNRWQLFVFDLCNPNACAGTVDWQRVSRIRLATAKDVVGVFYLNSFARSVPKEGGSSKRYFRGILQVPPGGETPSLDWEEIPRSDIERVLAPTDGDSVSLTWEQKNPTTYVANLTISSPRFLVLSCSYHPLWRANIAGEEIRSVPCYSAINGFYICQAGKYTITISFAGQKYFLYGFIVSLLSFGAAVLYLMCNSSLKRR